MRDYRNFFHSKKQEEKTAGESPAANKTGDRARVAFYTDLFAKVSKRFIATNSEYADLKEDIVGAVEPYGTKEDITLVVYETEKSDEFGRDSTLIGFRKYMKGCTAARLRTVWKRILLFSLFLLVGVFIEVALYSIPAWGGAISSWYGKTIEVFAGLFIWQIGGFLAFEVPGEIHTIRRYRQIIDRIDFEFKIFE